MGTEGFEIQPPCNALDEIAEGTEDSEHESPEGSKVGTDDSCQSPKAPGRIHPGSSHDLDEPPNAPVGALECLTECVYTLAGELAGSARIAQEAPTSEVSEVCEAFSNPMGRELATQAGGDVSSARMAQGTRTNNATNISEPEIQNDCLPNWMRCQTMRKLTFMLRYLKRSGCPPALLAR